MTKFNVSNPDHISLVIITGLTFSLLKSLLSYFISPSKIKIGKSRIPNSGDGVFAITDIKPGEIVCNTITDSKINDGVFKLNHEGIVDFKDIQNNLKKKYLHVPYIKKKVNTRAFVLCGYLFTQATKPIKSGEELTRYYGEQYWITHVCNNIFNDEKVSSVEKCIQWDEILKYISENEICTGQFRLNLCFQIMRHSV